LLSAIVRADGDALVMHVGERPYVVVGTQTINISTHGLTLDAMTGMLAQLLPADSQTQLEEFGAVEHRMEFQSDDRFTIVAARGGDDIWIEIRRRRAQPAVEAAPEPSPAPAVAAAAEVAPPPPVIEAPAPVPVVAEAPPVVEVPPPVVAEAAPPEPAVVEAPQPAPVVIEAIAPTLDVVETAPPVTAAVEEPTPVPAAAEAPAPEAPVLAPQSVLDTFVEEPKPVVASTTSEEPPVEAPPVEAPPAQLADVPEVAAQVEEPQPKKYYPPPVLIPPPPPDPEPEPIPAPVLETLSDPSFELIDDAPEEEQIAASIDEDEVDLPLEDEPVAPIIPAAPEPAIAQAPAPVAVQAPEPAVTHVSAPEPAVATPPAPAVEPEPMPIAASVEREPASAPGTVLPMTRTVRIEVPPRAPVVTATRSTDIERLLRIAAARGASSLFLTSESRPWMRVDGDLRQIETEPPLSRADVQRAVLEIAPESGHESIGKGEATEWISEFEEIGRIRCTTFVDHRGPGVLLRMIATRAATAEQLGLAREVQALATESQGLVLVAGSRASGKSTLISALVDLVNKQRAEFIITLERQIRLVHDNKSALVSQREIRGGAEESLAAARAALRENPDVLVVDDLVSAHMVPLLLTAASEGLLVFVTITAASTAEAIEKFIELAPPEMRAAVQSAMSETFRGAVAQMLLKKVGGGRIAARELMLATSPVTRVIGEGQLGQLPLVFDSGRKQGMVSFADALAECVRAGAVDVRDAFRKATDRDRLLERLKRDGVDTSVVDRLA
jgi:twitching motility protein PilT